MKPFLRYTGIKKEGEASDSSVNDPLVTERPLRILINGSPLSVTMQTPGDELDLVRGLLCNEDIYRGPESDLELRFIEDREGIVDEVRVGIPKNRLGDGYSNSRQLLSVASCGICGRTDFEGRKGAALNGYDLTPAFIHGMYAKMHVHQSLFAATGGCHGASCFDRDGQHLVTREDIGRHNAVDKAIGALLRAQKLQDAKVILVSGRISYEIVSKCFMAGIPALTAVSAPSTLAVDFAKELGVSLYAFCRGDRVTRYA